MRTKLLLLLAAGGAGVLPAQSSPAADDRAAIAAASRAFSAAYVANDSTALGRVYTDSAVLLPPGREIRGRAAVQRYFQWAPRYRQLAHAMTSAELRIRGDVAVDIGTWTSTAKRGDAEPTTASERYLVVWVREADGQWRIDYDMWHRPAPGRLTGQNGATPSSPKVN